MHRKLKRFKSAHSCDVGRFEQEIENGSRHIGKYTLRTYFIDRRCVERFFRLYVYFLSDDACVFMSLWLSLIALSHSLSSRSHSLVGFDIMKCALLRRCMPHKCSEHTKCVQLKCSF